MQDTMSTQNQKKKKSDRVRQRERREMIGWNLFSSFTKKLYIRYIGEVVSIVSFLFFFHRHHLSLKTILVTKANILLGHVILLFLGRRIKKGHHRAL